MNIKQTRSASKKLAKALHLPHFRLGSRRHYQQSRGTGTQQRWTMIRERIGKARSLMDIGCDMGVLTSLAATEGLFSLGLDQNHEAISRAKRGNAAQQGLAFSYFLASPDSISSLPSCDVVLCLSIYQHWHRQYGHQAAQEMLKTLGRKARRQLFFEPASRTQRYGESPPPFTSNNPGSIIKYTAEMLNDLFDNQNRVEFVGESLCYGKEQFRYLFVVNTDRLGEKINVVPQLKIA